MPFDLSAVTAQAQRVAGSGSENNEGEKRSYKYPLVYPGAPGTLQVKLLFNPKAGTVARLVNNHKVNGVNVPCMRTWDQECPICKALQDIKNATGDDHPQLRSTTRAISIAQIAGDNYPLPENVHKGDIVLLMYPWTVYRDIQQIIGQARNQEELAALVASNEGMVFNINHGTDNRYSTQTDPFARYKTCNTDEEFEALLNGLDSLNEQYRPSAPTEDQLNTINEAANELRNTFLAQNMNTPQYAPQPAQTPQVSFGGQPSGNPQMSAQTPNQTGFQANPTPTYSVPSTQPMMNQPAQTQPVTAAQMGFQVPTNPTPPAPTMNSAVATPTPTQTTTVNTMTNGRPECFGLKDSGQINPDQCALCGFEFDCIENPRR